jgi:hypothetical protein
MIRSLYRIEDPATMDGMWYDRYGNPKKRIHELCPNGIAKDFPMPLNRLHQKDGLVWNSAGDSIEQMNHWFTAEDAQSLYNNGFKLFEFLVDSEDIQQLENEVLFHRDSIWWQEEIPLEVIWEINR